MTFQSSIFAPWYFYLVLLMSVLTIVIERSGLNSNQYSGVGSDSVSWAIPTGLDGANVRAILIDSQGIYYVGTNGNGVFRSTDQGKMWTQINNGITGIANLNVFCLAQDIDGSLLVGTEGRLFRSTNSGERWEFVDLPGISGIQSISILKSATILGTSDGVAISSNDRKTWSVRQVMTLPTHNGATPMVSVRSTLAFEDGVIYAGTWVNGLFKSTDFGQHWDQIDTEAMFVTSIVTSSGGILFAANKYGILRSTNNGRTWVPSRGSSGTLHDVHSLFVTAQDWIYGAYEAGVLMSTDLGKTWQSSGFQYPAACVTKDKRGGILVGTNGGVYRASENGTGWFRCSNGLFGQSIFSISNAGNGRFVAHTASGFSISNDDGNSWSAFDLGVMNDSTREIVWSDENAIYLVTKEAQLQKSVDQCKTWEVIPLADDPPVEDEMIVAKCMVVLANGVQIVGTSNGLWRSTDSGRVWAHISGENVSRPIFSFARVEGLNVFAASDQGILMSQNFGETWTYSQLSGLDEPSIAIGRHKEIFVTAYNKIWHSFNGGKTWSSSIPGEQGGNRIFELAASLDGDVFCTTSAGLFVSKGERGGWTKVRSDPHINWTQCVFVTASGHLLVGTRFNGLLRSRLRW